MSIHRIHHRRGLTLMELVVVLLVLVLLAALIIPRVTGISEQAKSATNTDLVSEVNRAVSTYEARFGASPRTWDNIVPVGGTAVYTKLHPNLTPLLTVLELDANQAQSLTDAGIQGFMTVNESATGAPSDAASNDYAPVATGLSLPALVKQSFTGHGSTFLDRAFNVLPVFGAGGTSTPNPNEYVVLGIGLSSTLRGTSIMDAATVSSADPTQYYARMLCVYRIPPTGSATSFPAQYVGSFLPDGTCQKDNIDKYNTAN